MPQERPTNQSAHTAIMGSKDTNLNISDRLPEDYIPEVEAKHPGALASQWTPMDPALWKIERYLNFIEALKNLWTAETNKRSEALMYGDTQWLAARTTSPAAAFTSGPIDGITSEAEGQELETPKKWVEAQGLPCGMVAFDDADSETGAQEAVFDLAWPEGLQPGLSGPLVLLLNETAEVLALASSAGFRCLNLAAEFQAYVKTEILNSEDA